MSLSSHDIFPNVVHELEHDTAALTSIIGMAIFGGLVNWLRQKGPRKISKLVGTLCTAAFAGLIAYYITSAAGLNAQYQCAMSGIAGYGGGNLIDEAVNRVKDFILTKRKK